MATLKVIQGHSPMLVTVSATVREVDNLAPGISLPAQVDVFCQDFLNKLLYGCHAPRHFFDVASYTINGQGIEMIAGWSAS
jgi:hypothetical protein